MDAELEKLYRAYKAAQRAWNKDGGPIEKTVKAGEDLYFAAEFLIEALNERLAAK